MGIFRKISLSRPRSNKFDLSHERKFSLNMGNLVPMYVQDVVPGDRFRVNSQILLRLAPLLAPVMHRIDVFTHYFFVPWRLVWDESEDFITGGRLGTLVPVFPQITIGNTDNAALFRKGHLADYMGLPVFDAAKPAPVEPYGVSALPFRAYLNIFNEYYRDQNLEDEIAFPKTSGVIGDLNNAEVQKLLQIRVRAWEKDYFTSALPFAQRGGDVNVPLEYSPQYLDNSNVIANISDTAPDTSGNLHVLAPPAPNTVRSPHGGNPAEQMRIENLVDPQTLNPVTINELRRSVRLQEWLEKNARGGARYIEQILAHFGVMSSDARLQRPEYLGGGKQPVTVSEVLSTFQEATGEPQGNMAGHGFSIGNTHGFSKRFEEHGYVIGIMSVLPRSAYQQGIPRHFRKFDKFDHYWPEFSQLGEQEIKLSELFYDSAAAVGANDAVFGYQSRYAEYKYMPSTVHGEFRDTLAFWHMGRIFASAPVLNSGFVKTDPTQRIFAVEADSEHLYCQLYNRVDALRPMPYFNVPTL